MPLFNGPFIIVDLLSGFMYFWCNFLYGYHFCAILVMELCCIFWCMLPYAYKLYGTNSIEVSNQQIAIWSIFQYVNSCWDVYAYFKTEYDENERKGVGYRFSVLSLKSR